MLATDSGLIAVSPRARPAEAVHVPRTIEEACAVQRRHLERGRAAVYALGTTDLIADYRAGADIPALVSLHAVEELRGLEVIGGRVVIGAGTTHEQGRRHAGLRRLLPSLARAWGSIANVRVRFRATLGGNLCARKPRYELPLMLGVLDARLHVVDPADGQEQVRDVGSLLTGRWPPGALLRAATIEDAAGARFAYDRTMRPLQTVAVAARGAGDAHELRVAVGSEYHTPAFVRRTVALDAVLAGRAAVEDVAREVADALPAFSPDATASRSYRQRLAAVQVRRALLGWTRDLGHQQPVEG